MKVRRKEEFRLFNIGNSSTVTVNFFESILIKYNRNLLFYLKLINAINPQTHKPMP